MERLGGEGTVDCGDHEVSMWKVVTHSGPALDGVPLTTGELRERGLL